MIYRITHVMKSKQKSRRNKIAVALLCLTDSALSVGPAVFEPDGHIVRRRLFKSGQSFEEQAAKGRYQPPRVPAFAAADFAADELLLSPSYPTQKGGHAGQSSLPAPRKSSSAPNAPPEKGARSPRHGFAQPHRPDRETQGMKGHSSNKIPSSSSISPAGGGAGSQTAERFRKTGALIPRQISLGGCAREPPSTP